MIKTQHQFDVCVTTSLFRRWFMNTEYHSSGLYHVELLNAVYMRFFWLWRNSQKGLILHDALHINLQCSDLPWQVEIERLTARNDNSTLDGRLVTVIKERNASINRYAQIIFNEAMFYCTSCIWLVGLCPFTQAYVLPPYKSTVHIFMGLITSSQYWMCGI